MKETDQRERIKSILERRDCFIPLIPPAMVVTRDAVDAFLSEEEQAQKDNLQTLRDLLNNFGISLHAAYTDLRNHPEQLLRQQSKDPGLALQFAIRVPTKEDHLFSVVMNPQKIKSNGKNEVVCADALFCLTPVSMLQELRKEFITIFFHMPSTQPIYTNNFPKIYQHWTYFVFDNKGVVSYFIHTPHLKKRSILYDVSGKESRGVIVREYGYGAEGEKLPYRYCQNDQTFRREPVEKNTPTMQEEIAEALSKLPMPLENYDILSQFS